MNLNINKKKIEELIASNAKLAELLHIKQEEEEEKKNVAVYVFAVLGAIAVIGVVAYLVYRYLNPTCIEEGELEDEYEDFDDADFEDEDALNAVKEAVNDAVDTVAEAVEEAVAEVTDEQ